MISTPADATRTALLAMRQRPFALAAYSLIAVIWLARVLLEGFNGLIFSDAGAYLYAGNSLLDGRGLTAPDGNLFHAHGPIGPILIASASQLLGGNPFQGPKILFALILLASLFGVVRIAQLLGGDKAAMWTALGLAALPFAWSGFLEVLIDQAQLGLLVATILLLWKPTDSRVVAAGVVLAICILTKETTLPALILPLAWIGARGRKEVWRILGLFVATTIVGISWWWIVVLNSTGVVFPLDQLGRISSRSKEMFGADAGQIITLIVLGLAWVWFYRRERRSPRARLVMLAGLAMLPTALVAVDNQMDFRQLLIIGVLSCVAGGVSLAGWLSERAEHEPTRRVIAGSSLIAIVIALLSVPLIARAQLKTQPGRAINITQLVHWLDRNTTPEQQIAISYLHRREILSSVSHPLRLGTVIDVRSGDTEESSSRNTRVSISGCAFCQQGETPESLGLRDHDKGWVDLNTVRRALIKPEDSLIVISRMPILARFLLRNFPATELRYRQSTGVKAWVLSVDRSALPDKAQVTRILEENASELKPGAGR